MKRRGMTLTLLWNEYCEAALASGREPFLYSAFCKAHRKWAQSYDVRMHIEHAPGEQIQVDFAGDTGEIVDPDTGEITRVIIFVACLPWSGYIYAEGMLSADAQSWVRVHTHMFSHLGGAAPYLTPDNAKCAVIKNTKDELIIHEQYRSMAEHYGCAVIPARPRKPRDKAAVEMSVGVVQRQALAALRDRRFFSLSEFNEALFEQVAAINARPFQKKPGSREELFFGQEKDALIPLPADPYEYKIRKVARVNFNYHACFEGVWYSVPHRFVKCEVTIMASPSVVAIYFEGDRIANHRRAYAKGSYVTDVAHMPDAHRDFVEWNGERFRKWAASIGPDVEKVVECVLSSRRIEQQTYRSARALLSLAEKYGKETLGAACAHALSLSSRPSYKTVKSVIGRLGGADAADEERFAYLRGRDYYQNLENDQ